MSALKEKVIGLVNYQPDKDYAPSSSRKNSNRDRLSARSLLSKENEVNNNNNNNSKVLNENNSNYQLSARSLLSLDSDDNIITDDVTVRKLTFEQNIHINNTNDNEESSNTKELNNLRRKVVILETSLHEACKQVSLLLEDNNNIINNNNRKNSIKSKTDDKNEDLLPLLSSLSSNYKKLIKEYNILNDDVIHMKESYNNDKIEYNDRIHSLQQIVKELQDEDSKNKKYININMYNLQSEKDLLNDRNQSLQLENAKILSENETLRNKIIELESTVLDIPRLEDKYLREAKKIVHEKALEIANVQVNLKKMEKSVQSLAYYQYKTKDLEEQNLKLRLANESLQRQCRITLRKVQSTSNINSKNEDTTTTSKIKLRPLSASAVLASVNIEDSLGKSAKSNNENGLLLTELKSLREKNFQLEEKVSSLRHKLAVARAYPLRSTSAGPLEFEIVDNKKSFNNNNNNNNNNNSNDNNFKINTRINDYNNNNDEEVSEYDIETYNEIEQERLKKTAEMSEKRRERILSRQKQNYENDPNTATIRQTKTFPKQLKVVNKFLN